MLTCWEIPGQHGTRWNKYGTRMASWTRPGCTCKKRFWLATAHLGCSRLSAILSVPLISLLHKHITIQLVGQHCLLWRLKNQTVVPECVWVVWAPEQPRNVYTFDSGKVQRSGGDAEIVDVPLLGAARGWSTSAKDIRLPMVVLPTRLQSYEHGGFVSSISSKM